MNKKLFATQSVPVVAEANTVNHAGGKAYALSDQAALAQYASTGTFNGTFYTSDKDQLKTILELASKCSPEFIAKVAVYAREQNFMKDVPAFLTAILASKDTVLLQKIFARVIDNPKMVRNFVQMIRSGVTGRKSFGSAPKKLLQKFLNNLTDDQLFKAQVGNDPKLADIIKMVRPKPADKQRSALHAYILDREHDASELPSLVKAFEDFKKNMIGEMPNVPFEMLTALPLTDKHWKQIAENATWNQTKKNLNTFLRHNVLKDEKMVNMIAARLQDEDLIKKAKVFPYELFAAFKNVEAEIPQKITLALQKAAEIAIQNIPEFNGKIYVFPDVSGSMGQPVTGNRGTASSKVRCVDVAGLISASILRKNPEAIIMPFDTQVHSTQTLNALDSIMTNAQKLAAYGGGGTSCELPLQKLNAEKAKGDLLIYVSDCESWHSNRNYGAGTGVASEWATFKKRNPNAKLVEIDLTPNTTSQVNSQKDVIQIGGFNDSIFSVIAAFVKNGNDPETWVKMINESTKLD